MEYKSVVMMAAVIIVLAASLASAVITVHEPNFVVDTLLDHIDGTTPRLEAVRNPDYGFGIVAASVDEGILKVLRISQSNVELLGTMAGFPAFSMVGGIRFDKTGLFGNELYLTVISDSGCTPPESVHTDVLQVSAGGVIKPIASLGDCVDKLGFTAFDFVTGAGGYSPGAYLLDGHAGNGTSWYHMNSEFNLTKLSQDYVPPGRTDLDCRGMEFDPTGVYGSYLTMVDSDRNNDDLTMIYQLLSDLSWAQLTTPVSTYTRLCSDMSFSPGGSFGQLLYVTECLTDTIMTVDTNGVHSEFASGFDFFFTSDGLRLYGSITVSEDGEYMFVSDENGVYRIRAGTTTVGPTLVMQEPKVESDGVHTNPSGLSNIRLLWNERIIFNNDDVDITDANDLAIPCSVSGSNSQFMVVVFGKTLLNNEYTITISDSVVSSETGSPIDGDDDGTSGGDAVIVMEHRKRSDFDNDNDVDLSDLVTFALDWLWVQ